MHSNPYLTASRRDGVIYGLIALVVVSSIAAVYQELVSFEIDTVDCVFVGIVAGFCGFAAWCACSFRIVFGVVMLAVFVADASAFASWVLKRDWVGGQLTMGAFLSHLIVAALLLIPHVMQAKTAKLAAA